MKMLKLNLNIKKVFAVKSSYLETYLQNIKYPYKIIDLKQSLINGISSLKFDILVSTGCPYILPVSSMIKKNQKFINVHPSLLPDLKGKHPINGAILFSRRHGVTCHMMDDGIDTGAILSQIEIPTSDLGLDLLYQLSFRAEAKAFEAAYLNNFEPLGPYVVNSVIEPIYYSRKDSDMVLSKNDSLEMLLRKIRAFGIQSLCARFYNKQVEYRVLSARIIENDTLSEYFNNISDNTIAMIYSSKILAKIHGKLIEFTMLNTDGLEEGSFVFD